MLESQRSKGTYSDMFSSQFLLFISFQALKKLNHINIVRLKELFRQGTELYFVFELCEGNLYDKMKSPDLPFTEERIKNVMFDTFFFVLFSFHATSAPQLPDS
jgi:hypothetical protein